MMHTYTILFRFCESLIKFFSFYDEFLKVSKNGNKSRPPSVPQINFLIIWNHLEKISIQIETGLHPVAFIMLMHRKIIKSHNLVLVNQSSNLNASVPFTNWIHSIFFSLSKCNKFFLLFSFPLQHQHQSTVVSDSM